MKGATGMPRGLVVGALEEEMTVVVFVLEGAVEAALKTVISYFDTETVTYAIFGTEKKSSKMKRAN
jgi:hypothetical protein